MQTNIKVTTQIMQSLKYQMQISTASLDSFNHLRDNKTQNQTGHIE